VGEKSGLVSEWKFLKTGVYFLPDRGMENGGTGPYSIDTKNPYSRFTEVDVAFPDPGDPEIPLPAIGFKPDGSLKSGALAKEVYLSEGYITAAVGLGDIKFEDLHFKPAATVVGFEVLGLTGMQRIRVYGEE
jgi:hypothetical protein